MNLTDLARAALGAVRAAGPVLVAIAVAVLLVELASASGRARLRISRLGLSRRPDSRLARVLAGTLVPTLGIAALAVSLALEVEVRNGPSRMITQLQSGAGSSHEPVAWVLQKGTHHFMDDSRLPVQVVAAAVDGAGGAAAQLVWEQLTTVTEVGAGTNTGLVLATEAHGSSSSAGLLPQVNARTARCQRTGGTCELHSDEVIAEADVYPVGTKLQLRERQVTVVANPKHPYSLINRVVVFASPQLFTRPDGTPSDPYAVVVGGPKALELAHDIAAVETDQVEVLSTSQLLSYNATFWAGNGTPLLLLVIALSAVFCGVALYAARRALQHRERTPAGTLRALGLTLWSVCRIDLTRATITCLISAGLAVPVAYLLLRGVDAGMLGFHAALTAADVLAAAGVLVAANALGTGVLLIRQRQVPLTDVMDET